MLVDNEKLIASTELNDHALSQANSAELAVVRQKARSESKQKESDAYVSFLKA
jgi:hypothetical protein